MNTREKAKQFLAELRKLEEKHGFKIYSDYEIYEDDFISDMIVLEHEDGAAYDIRDIGELIGEERD